MSQSKYLFGIQSGDIHIGNFLSLVASILNGVRYVLIADLHRETSVLDCPEAHVTKTLVEKIFKFLQVDNYKVIIQSETNVEEKFWKFLCRSQLQWILSSYDDHIEDGKKRNLGLLTYPILMAADIAISACDYVVVGQDQQRNCEIVNKVLRSNNYKPVDFIMLSCKVMDLKKPQNKMSKSSGSPLFISDSPESIKEKVVKSVTTEEGINNWLRVLTNLRTIKTFMNDSEKVLLSGCLESIECGRYLNFKLSMVAILSSIFTRILNS